MSNKEENKQNERIRALEVQMESIMEMFREMKTMVTEKLPTLVKEGFRDIREEMREEHKEDMKAFDKRLKKNEEKIAGLEVLSFFSKHPRIAGIIILGMYALAISDVRDLIKNTFF